MEKSNKQQTNN